MPKDRKQVKAELCDFDEIMYVVAKRRFAGEYCVSTASMQRFMQIPYILARRILNKMIEEEFCEPQDGAKPCRILSDTKIEKN